MRASAACAGATLAVVLSACTSSSDTSAAGGSSSSASTGSSSGVADAACKTNDLKVSLGDRTAGGGAGQYEIPISFKNTGSSACTVTGAPTITLQGPSDPNGTDYKIGSGDKSGGAPVSIASGSSAVAMLTVLTPEGGDTGSNGSTSWTPTTLIASAPGDTATASVAWPSDLAVLRQDTATRQGTYVDPFTAATS